MEKIGVRELKALGSEIVRRVREDGAAYEVTYHGRVVARLVPVQGEARDSMSDAEWEAECDALVDEIAKASPAGGVSAVDLVREQRREFLGDC
ncbi:MAG: Antitoxin [Chloroflexi bacterium]|nr:Antitoxin [Chloroflexota bacterium]